jgi:hypothetical protein
MFLKRFVFLASAAAMLSMARVVKPSAIERHEFWERSPIGTYNWTTPKIRYPYEPKSAWTLDLNDTRSRLLAEHEMLLSQVLFSDAYPLDEQSQVDRYFSTVWLWDDFVFLDNGNAGTLEKSIHRLDQLKGLRVPLVSPGYTSYNFVIPVRSFGNPLECPIHLCFKDFWTYFMKCPQMLNAKIAPIP